MSYIQVFILLLRAVRWFQNYLERKGMLEAAREQALKELGESANVLIAAATNARAGVSMDPGSLLNDPHRRENQ
jgi:hypothetical protein